MDVPFNRLDPTDDAEHRALLDAMRVVIERGLYLNGPETQGFEREFARFLGVDPRRAVAVGNGTDALELALAALDLEPGSPVLTTANAGGYATTALRLRGLRPLYVEIEAESGLPDPDAVERALADRPAAAIVTHLYGRPVDAVRVVGPLLEAGVPVVEDCAQAHGARAGERPVGTIGTVATFSFYPTKNLGALGDAGAVVGGSADIAERVRRLARYGWAEKYRVVDRGGRNSRMDELQAAALRLALPRLERRNRRRAEIAAAYRDGIDHPAIHADPPVTGEVNHLFVVRCAQRDALAAWLAEHGIGTAVHYPVPDHQQPAWRDAGHPVELPVTELRARHQLSLPCHPLLSDQDIEHVIRSCNRFRT